MVHVLVTSKLDYWKAVGDSPEECQETTVGTEYNGQNSDWSGLHIPPVLLNL